MANVFLISSRNRRSIRATADHSKPTKNLTVKRSDSSSDYNNNYSCKKHPRHRQSPGICSLCLNESLSKLSIDFHDYSASMITSSSKVDKTASSTYSSASSESESESEYSSTAISSHYSSVSSSCLSPLQHRYSEIVVNKKKKKHPKKKTFLSRLFL